MKMRDWASAAGGDSNPFGTDNLRDDLRGLAGDMEQLLRATASQTGQQIAQARARAEDSLKAVRARMADAQESALANARAAGKATDEYVRENPWQVLGIAAVVGLAVGFLLAYTSSSDS